MSCSACSSSQQSYSPIDRLQSALAAQVQAGTINAGDQGALSSALSDIKSALGAGAGGAASGERPDKAQFKAKLNSLIGDEVQAGKLTQDQANELKQLFASVGGKHGHHGGRRHDSDGDGGQQASSTSGTSSGSQSSAAQALQDSLTALLAAVQNAQKAISGYTDGGSAQTTIQNTTSLLDIQA